MVLMPGVKKLNPLPLPSKSWILWLKCRDSFFLSLSQGKENNKKQAVAASPVDKKRRTEKNDDIVETVSSSSSPLKSPSKSSTLSSSVAAAVAASPRKSTTTAATAAAKPFTSNPSSSSPSSSTDNAPTKDDLLQNGMWAEGKQVPYSALCAVFEKIEATSKRLEITELLVQFFRQVILRSPECMVMAVYLCLNKVGPDYDGKELGIGESLLMKAIERSTGLTLADVKREATKKGDLGQGE